MTTESLTPTPTNTSTPTNTPSNTPTNTITPSHTPTNTPTPSYGSMDTMKLSLVYNIIDLNYIDGIDIYDIIF
jgi:hypothetical protein